MKIVDNVSTLVNSWYPTKIELKKLQKKYKFKNNKNFKFYFSSEIKSLNLRNPVTLIKF